MLKALWEILRLECIVLLRCSKQWLYPVAFFLIVLSLFPLSLSPDPVFLKKYIFGFVWVAALFANLLSLQNLYVHDIEAGHLDQLLLSPYPLPALISVKLFAHWLVSSFSLILLTPIIGLFFQMDLSTVGLLSLSLLLGTPIIVLIGAFSVSLTLGLGQQGLMLGLMMLPLLLPIIIFSSNIFNRTQLGMPILGTIALLTGILIFTLLFMPLVIAAALRLSLDE